MKRIELFKCEICGVSYKSEDMANRCERSHKIVKSIQYRSFSSNAKGYPDKITVCFNDDTKVIYMKGKELS